MKKSFVQNRNRSHIGLRATMFLLLTMLTVPSVQPVLSESSRTLSAEAKTSTAEVFLARKDWSKAEQLLRKALSDSPDYPKALQLLGYALCSQNKPSEAVPYLKNAVEDSACPNRDETLAVLGQILIDQNRANESIQYLQESISLNPDKIETYNALFNAYQKTGNLTEALKTGKQIIQRFPKDPRCAELKKWISKINPEQEALSIASASSSDLDNYFTEITAADAARWDADIMPIRVYIEPALKLSQWKPEYDSILKKAFESWSAASKNLVSFTFVNNAADAQIKCRWTSKTDDLSGSLEQGVTRSKFQENKLLKVDITILMCLPNQPKIPVSKEIISKTCLHEIGHALGISGHSPNPRDIMYFKEEDDGKVLGLSQRDRKTVQLLYTQPLNVRNQNTALAEKARASAYTFEEGVRFINRNDYDGAVNCFKYLLTKDPSSSSARINLGIAYAGLAMQCDEEKRFSEAELYYKQALEIRHEIPDRHTLDAAVKNYAAMLRELGRESDAKKVENEL
jgi:tetratricopeptide (TPR) repeat protein